MSATPIVPRLIARSVYQPLGPGRRNNRSNERRRHVFRVNYPDLNDFLANYRRRPNGRGNRNVNVVTYRRRRSARGQQDPNREISVEDCDLQIAKNAKAHHTDEYEVTGLESGNPGKLVVRRGQTFDIKFEFSKPYDKSKDDLRIVFECGENPTPSKGTEVELILSDKDVPNKWGAKILKQEGNNLYVTIFTPPNCYVAKWEMSVDVIKKENNDVKVYRYEHDDPIYMIFNPWCKGDTVYMEDEKMINEYVMNEHGRIFTGSKNQISYKPWNFGQFESCALDVALYLLDIVNLPMHVRGNPIPVIRKLSAAVNSSDDNGILEGNWSGDYYGGRSPLSWSGSMAILEQYWETKRPVKYGQCWVFSGLCTTVARALGIPARTLTNFASAHDTDGSITIDVECDRHGEPLDDNPDSIWNFHVWNEAWMARPDLPHGFGGWQAFDATPQETSDGIYCCGPVSVAAIRQGNVNMPYDAPFVFAEVNADRVWWKPDNTGTNRVWGKQKNAVGKNISTKAVGGWGRDDITQSYKPKEGSAEERAAVLKANQMASTRDDVYVKTAEDVSFEVVQDSDNTWVGQDFKVGLKMKNNSKQERSVNGKIVVKTMFYTGVVADKLGYFDINKTLKAGASETVNFTVKPNQYLDFLKDCCMLDVAIWATVSQTNQVFVVKEDCRLKKPHLTVKGPGEANKNKEFEVQVSFQNPLETSLTECVVTVDGLARNLRFPQKNVNAKGTFMTSLPITPMKVGHKELVIIFSSKQLDDINGQKSVFVRGQTR